MNTPHRPSHQFLPGRARQAPALADPADMGTCFGLEMILALPPGKPAGRAAGAHWWHRLGFTGRKETGSP